MVRVCFIVRSKFPSLVRYRLANTSPVNKSLTLRSLLPTFYLTAQYLSVFVVIKSKGTHEFGRLYRCNSKGLKAKVAAVTAKGLVPKRPGAGSAGGGTFKLAVRQRAVRKSVCLKRYLGNVYWLS